MIETIIYHTCLMHLITWMCFIILNMIERDIIQSSKTSHELIQTLYALSIVFHAVYMSRYFIWHKIHKYERCHNALYPTLWAAITHELILTVFECVSIISDLICT
jgi:hypothetical protein